VKFNFILRIKENLAMEKDQENMGNSQKFAAKMHLIGRSCILGKGCQKCNQNKEQLHGLPHNK
jgi:hypothetical protein